MPTKNHSQSHLPNSSFLKVMSYHVLNNCLSQFRAFGLCCVKQRTGIFEKVWWASMPYYCGLNGATIKHPKT